MCFPQSIGEMLSKNWTTCASFVNEVDGSDDFPFPLGDFFNFQPLIFPGFLGLPIRKPVSFVCFFGVTFCGGFYHIMGKHNFVSPPFGASFLVIFGPATFNESIFLRANRLVGNLPQMVVVIVRVFFSLPNA